MGRIEDLENIKVLRQKGIITEKEFEEEKYKILNSNANANTTSGLYIISLILGIIALLLCLVPIFGMIIGIIAIMVSIKADEKKKANNEKRGDVTAGLTLSLIGGIIATIWSGINVGFILAAI